MQDHVFQLQLLDIQAAMSYASQAVCNAGRPERTRSSTCSSVILNGQKRNNTSTLLVTPLETSSRLCTHAQTFERIGARPDQRTGTYTHKSINLYVRLNAVANCWVRGKCCICLSLLSDCDL